MWMRKLHLPKRQDRPHTPTILAWCSPSVEHCQNSTCCGLRWALTSSLPTTSNVVVLNGSSWDMNLISRNVVTDVNHRTHSEWSHKNKSVCTVLEFQKNLSDDHKYITECSPPPSALSMKVEPIHWCHDPSSYETWTGPISLWHMSMSSASEKAEGSSKTRSESGVHHKDSHCMKDPFPTQSAQRIVVALTLVLGMSDPYETASFWWAASLDECLTGWHVETTPSGMGLSTVYKHMPGWRQRENSADRIARLGTATPWTAMQRQTIMASDKHRW